MNTAIVHEYFGNIGGSEAVVNLFHQMFPQAPVYTIFARDHHRKNGLLEGVDLKTSFIQRLPYALDIRFVAESEHHNNPKV